VDTTQSLRSSFADLAVASVENQIVDVQHDGLVHHSCIPPVLFWYDDIVSSPRQVFNCGKPQTFAPHRQVLQHFAQFLFCFFVRFDGDRRGASAARIIRGFSPRSLRIRISRFRAKIWTQKQDL
jgi:hypothetical protein